MTEKNEEKDKKEEKEPGETFTCIRCKQDYFLTDDEIEEGYDTEICEDCQAKKLASYEVDKSEESDYTGEEPDPTDGLPAAEDQSDDDDDDDNNDHVDNNDDDDNVKDPR